MRKCRLIDRLGNVHTLKPKDRQIRLYLNSLFPEIPNFMTKKSLEQMNRQLINKVNNNLLRSNTPKPNLWYSPMTGVEISKRTAKLVLLHSPIQVRQVLGVLYAIIKSDEQTQYCRSSLNGAN